MSSLRPDPVRDIPAITRIRFRQPFQHWAAMLASAERGDYFGRACGPIRSEDACRAYGPIRSETDRLSSLLAAESIEILPSPTFRARLSGQIIGVPGAS